VIAEHLLSKKLLLRVIWSGWYQHHQHCCGQRCLMEVAAAA
jgi:hypothetical protein